MLRCFALPCTGLACLVGQYPFTPTELKITNSSTPTYVHLLYRQQPESETTATRRQILLVRTFCAAFFFPSAARNFYLVKSARLSTSAATATRLACVALRRLILPVVDVATFLAAISSLVGHRTPLPLPPPFPFCIFNLHKLDVVSSHGDPGLGGSARPAYR